MYSLSWVKKMLLWGMVLLAVGSGGFTLGHSARAAGIEPGSDADPLVAKSYVDQFVSLQVVNLSPGQRLLAGAGAELIVREGTAKVIAGSGGGLANLTAGKELKAGETVVLNHLLLVPRDDGRGLLAATKLVLLVRGTYSLVVE